MILIFNKQFRQEEKLIMALAKKIKKSESIKCEYDDPNTGQGNMGIYRLDDIDLYFNLDNHNPKQIRGSLYSITVKDKEGNVIYTMDCHYDMYDQMQNKRNDWFSWLLNKAREVYKERGEKAKKVKAATEKVKAKEQKRQAIESAEQKRNAAIKEALSKLR